MKMLMANADARIGGCVTFARMVLVGPVLKPRENACWTCLSDRMLRNREIKGFLDRSEARTVSRMISKTLGALGGTTRRGHHGFDFELSP